MAKKEPEEADEDEVEEEPVRFGRRLVLEYDGTYWSGELLLPKLKKYTDGAILVEIEDLEGEFPATVRKGFTWLFENEAAVAKSMIAAIAKAHPEVAKKLVDHIELVNVTIHNVKKGTRPYLGFSWWCDWDREHGLGVMMHGPRVVQVGPGDTAILDWIAEADAKPKRAKKKKR